MERRDSIELWGYIVAIILSVIVTESINVFSTTLGNRAVATVVCILLVFVVGFLLWSFSKRKKKPIA